MKVERGQAAFITGGGGGIGRALALALAGRGVHLTILDLKPAEGEETVRLVEEEHARISYKPAGFPSAIFIQCDVAKSDELAAAFARHHHVFERLDVCVNNAGIGGAEPFYEVGDMWRKVIEVNLIAVIDGTSKAIQAMKQKGGLILNLGSAASFIPLPIAPVYAASKGGVGMFTRSLAHLGMGIRVNAICPACVETPLFQEVLPVSLGDFLRNQVGLVTMERVLEAAFSLLDDESKAGECVWIPGNRPTQTWPDEATKSKYQALTKDGSVFTGVFN